MEAAGGGGGPKPRMIIPARSLLVAIHAALSVHGMRHQLVCVLPESQKLQELPRFRSEADVLNYLRAESNTIRLTNKAMYCQPFILSSGELISVTIFSHRAGQHPLNKPDQQGVAISHYALDDWKLERFPSN